MHDSEQQGVSLARLLVPFGFSKSREMLSHKFHSHPKGKEGEWLEACHRTGHEKKPPGFFQALLETNAIWGQSVRQAGLICTNWRSDFRATQPYSRARLAFRRG